MQLIGWLWNLKDTPPILLSTAPRYLALSQWTVLQIERFWKEHPQIFISGAHGDPKCLQLRDDPANWMRVTASACQDLLQRGHDLAFLILDDHPPIAECNGEFLNNSMPRMMREKDATLCLAVGPGPILKRKGFFEECGNYRFEKLSVDEPWKLALHPALWNLKKLHEILLHLMEKLPVPQQNPWAFERIGSSAAESGLSRDLLASCWRVDGWQSATKEAKRLHDLRDLYTRTILRSATMALRPIGLSAEKFKNRIAGLWHPRLGAYPCFWSGIMKKGALNGDYLFYASIKNRPELVDGIETLFPAQRA